MTAEACKNCHYSRPSGMSYKVECRRFPPSVLIGSLGSQPRSAPVVSESAWCGEWRAHGKRPADPEPETSVERMFKWFWR